MKCTTTRCPREPSEGFECCDRCRVLARNRYQKKVGDAYQARAEPLPAPDAPRKRGPQKGPRKPPPVPIRETPTLATIGALLESIKRELAAE